MTEKSQSNKEIKIYALWNNYTVNYQDRFPWAKQLNYAIFQSHRE